jgi:hypothetical protein
MLSSYEKQTPQHIPSMVPFLVFKQVLRLEKIWACTVRSVSFDLSVLPIAFTSRMANAIKIAAHAVFSAVCILGRMLIIPAARAKSPMDMPGDRGQN